MKKTDKSIKTLFVLIPIYLSIFIVILFLGSKQADKKIENILEETINEDYEARIYEMGRTQLAGEKPDRKIKEYTIFNQESIQNVVFPESISVRKADQLINQYMMAIYHPLNPDKMNKIFKSKLDNANIHAQTGIMYQHDAGQVIYSNSDSTTLSHASYQTTKHIIDYPQTSSIQGWADYGIKTWLAYTNWTALSIITSAFIILYLLICKKKAQKVEPEIKIEQLPPYKSNPTGISIDFINHSFTIQGKKHMIPKKTLEVLNLFLQTSNCQLTCAEIHQTIWKNTTDEAGRSNVYTHINNLRRALESFEGYKIITIKNEGYQLIYPQDGLNYNNEKN